MRNIYLQKSCWKWGQGNSPVSFCLFKKNFTKDKSKWLKLQVSRPETPSKRDCITGIFLWISHDFFKPLFTERFWVTAFTDSSDQRRCYRMITLFLFFPPFFSFYYCRVSTQSGQSGKSGKLGKVREFARGSGKVSEIRDFLEKIR